MDGKSKTLGWDALVSYDQAKINMLMEQQYVSKVGAEQIIPPISQRISGPGVTNVITGMVLGNPLLSFESADLLNSRANLTMPFLAGAFTTEIRSTGVPGHIDKMSTVVPGCDYVLTMSIDLQGSTGAISGIGEVYLDLGTGVDFKVNFVETPEEQNRIGDFFDELYKIAPAEVKRFVLGMLDEVGDYALTPQKFYIRTQPAPDAKLRGSASYGVGAVVLFVKTLASSGQPDGTFPSPSSDFRYLIPNDMDAVGKPLYSATVLIASKTLFGGIVAPSYQKLIEGGLSFRIINGATNDLACGLEAVAGEQRADSVFALEAFSSILPGGTRTETKGSGNVSQGITSVYLPCASMNIVIGSDSLVNSWNKKYIQTFRMKRDYPIEPEKNDQWDVEDEVDFECGSTAALTLIGSTNTVKFSLVGSPHISVIVTPDSRYYGGTTRMKEDIKGGLIDRVTTALNVYANFELPEISLFTLTNLLFPEKNTLQLTSAYLPGDLACFGQLAPERSSFRIAPLQPVVVAGQTQQFLVDTPDYSNEPVLWSVQAVAGGLPGTIDATNGLYRAPSPVSGAMAAQAHQDIVTATIGTGADLKQASAVAVVVNHSITVNPAFKLYDPLVGSVELAAAAQSANVVWRMVSGDGTLNPLSGLSTTFTPNPPTGSAVQVSVIEARDVEQGDTCRSTILTLKSGTVLTFEIDPVSMEALGPLESQQLRVLNAGSEEDPTGFSWSVLSGGGTVSSSGLYKAPGDIEDSCAVVWVTLTITSTMKFYGYAVIPLKR